VQEGGTGGRENCGEGVERALVLVLDLGGVVGPLLHRRQLLALGLAAQIVRRVGHDADIDAVLVMGVEEILEHHGAAALAPFRSALAVVGAEIAGRLLRRVDMRMPVDDHAKFSSQAVKRGNSRSAFSRRIAVMSAAGSSNLRRWSAIVVVDPNGASEP